MLYVALYLAAAIAANVLVGIFGPSISILDAFLFIGLNITTRDVLHDRWGKGYKLRMALLIGAGSLLSWLLSPKIGHIALASFVAFAASEIADTATYQVLHKRPWLQRVNGSNVVAAAVDSLLFPTIAFGGFMPIIVLGQFAAKTLGGGMWAWIIARQWKLGAVVLILLFAPAVLRAQAPKAVIQLQAGTNHYEFKNYRPTFNAGINSIIFLPKKFSVLLVLSRDFERTAKPTGIIALQWRAFTIK